jgi:hypothetical protein
MVVVADIVYLVWSENVMGDGEEPREIFFSMSIDGGNTFSEKENLSNNDTTSVSPAIAVSQNEVHVVWSDLLPREILYRRSLDGGQTFEIAKNLSSNPSSSLQPNLVSLRDRLYVTWSDSSAGNLEIIFTRSENGGDTFDSVKRLSNNPGDSQFSRIAVFQNEVYIVWDIPGGIFFIRSHDDGKTFGAATIIIPGASDPAITVSQNIA